MNYRKLQEAVIAAEKVIKDEKLELPIDLLELARRHDVLVQAKPGNITGVSGMLIRVKESFTIVYATHIRNEGFQRFSIAHEFGHYFLSSHPDYIFHDGKDIHESFAGFGSGDQIELEADHFAAGLLMPSHLFVKEARKLLDGFTAVEKLAGICKTSLTASAIRYVELTDAAMAVIISSGATIEYCFASKAMQQIKGYSRIKKGTALPQGSLTKSFNQMPINVESGRRSEDDTDLMFWFNTDNEIEANEEVIGLGEYGKTLTIITAEIPDDDNELEYSLDEPFFH